MGLFDKAERNVENHNSGVTNKYDKFGRKIFNIPEKTEAVEEHVTATIIQGKETQKPELSEGEKFYRETQINKAINKNNTTEYLKQLSENTKTGVLENVLTSIYYDALFLDDEFKEFNASVVQETVHDYIVKKGGYKYIEEAYNRTKSPLIKAIMNICEETSKEINDRKMKEMRDNEEFNFKLFKFDMNQEEKDKLDYKKESIGLEQISNSIKNKVLNVVKEEKKREAEHTELMDEIEAQLSDDPNVNDAETVAEALNSIFINNVNIEEATLFNTLLRTNCKKVLENGYESLELERMNVDNSMDDILDKVTLENVLIDDEFTQTNCLSNENIKNIFDDFIYSMESQNDEDDLNNIVESFSYVQNKFEDIAKNAVNKFELYQLRNDFRILQETFEEVIESAKNAKEGKDCLDMDKVDKKHTIVNDANLDAVKDAKNPPTNKAKNKANGDVIDTVFDQDVLRGKNKKAVKEDAELDLEFLDDDFDDEIVFNDDLDVTEEASANHPGVKFMIKNIGTMYANMYKASLDINKIQPGLLKMVKRCKTEREITYLEKDANTAVGQINAVIKNFDDDKKIQQYKKHVQWLKEVYKPAIKAKKKEIMEKENNKKAVKECVVEILENCVNIIDNKIEMHHNADEFARHNVLENYMGEDVLIPIVNKSDSQLDGLKLAYKMKHVIESLTVLMDKYDGADNIALIKKAIDSNKENTKFVLESFKTIPSTPVHKINYFNTFNELLQVLDNNINDACALYENFDITEYDEITDDVLIDEEHGSFRMITESVNDNPVEGEVNYIDMDFILANTLLNYTLLETMYTLQIDEYNYNSIKKMTNNMLNK